MSCRLWQVVVYLSRIRLGVQLPADCSQRPGDEIGGALVSHAKHHGRSDIESVALPMEMPCAPSWDDVPAYHLMVNAGENDTWVLDIAY